MTQADEGKVEPWNGAAERYEEVTKRHKYFAYEWISRNVFELEDLAECRVLDVGCGTGLSVKLLSECREGIRADGIDISPKMIEHARATGRYERLYTHDLDNGLPEVAPDAFDLVIAFGFLEFLADVHLCLSACTRALKPGGLLWATFRRFEPDDAASPPRVAIVGGRRRTGYSAGEILFLMSTLNMRVVGLESVIAFFTPSGLPVSYFVLQARKAK